MGMPSIILNFSHSQSWSADPLYNKVYLRQGNNLGAV